MRRLKTVVSALAIGLMLVTSLDYMAYAATGHSVLLGKINKSRKTTTFQSTTSAPAVKLLSKGAPFAVGNNKMVKNLNADMLDGLHATSLLTTKASVLRYDVDTTAATTPGLLLIDISAQVGTGKPALVSYSLANRVSNSSGTSNYDQTCLVANLKNYPLTAPSDVGNVGLVSDLTQLPGEYIANNASGVWAGQVGFHTYMLCSTGNPGGFQTQPASTGARVPMDISVTRLDGATTTNRTYAGSKHAVGKSPLAKLIH